MATSIPRPSRHSTASTTGSVPRRLPSVSTTKPRTSLGLQRNNTMNRVSSSTASTKGRTPILNIDEDAADSASSNGTSTPARPHPHARSELGPIPLSFDLVTASTPSPPTPFGSSPGKPPVPRTSLLATPPRQRMSAPGSVAPSPRKATPQRTPVRKPSVPMSLSTLGVNGHSPGATSPLSRSASMHSTSSSASPSEGLSASVYSQDDEKAFQWGTGASVAMSSVMSLSRFGDDDITVDMVTDPGDADQDEEFTAALQQLDKLHATRLASYKRILERTQASTAAQLHALQAEVAMLRANARSAQQPVTSSSMEISFGFDGEECTCGARRGKGYWSGYRYASAADLAEDEANARELFKALGAGEDASNVNGVKNGSVNGTKVRSKRRADEIDETAVRRVVRALARKDRTRIAGVILDSLHPGDIPLQILLLQKYARATFDVLGHLAPVLALRVLVAVVEGSRSVYATYGSAGGIKGFRHYGS